MKASSLRWNPTLVVTGMLVGLIVVSIWVWPQWDISLYSSDSLHALYLLSAIAQSLAVIAGLVVGASLVTSQTSSRQKMGAGARAANRLTLEFLLLNVATLVVSLCLIASPHPEGVKFALTFAGAALVMLVPFLLAIKERLNVERQIEDMQESAKSQLKECEEEPQEVQAIDGLTVHAYVNKDYEVFERGLNALSEVATVAYENLKIDAGHSTFDRLIEIADLSIEDARASARVIEMLENIGLKYTDRGSELVPNRVIRGVKRIGLNAAARQLEQPAVRAIRVMEKMSIRMAEKAMYDAAAEVLSAIEALSMRSLTKDLTEPVEISIDIIKRLAAIGPAATERTGRKAGKNTHADIIIQLAKTIDSIVAKAIECNNESVVTKAVVTLQAISQAAAEGSLPQDAGEIAIRGLRSIGTHWRIEGGTEIVCQAISVLGEAALGFADNDRAKLMWSAIDAAGAIGLKHSSKEITDKLVSLLGDIGMRAVQKEVFEGLAAAEILSKIGIRALKNGDAVEHEKAASALRAIAQKAAADRSQYFARKANEALLAMSNLVSQGAEPEQTVA